MTSEKIIKQEQRHQEWRLTCALVVFSILLSACGFKLRTHSPEISIAQLKQIDLDCPKAKSWELCHHLRQQFKLHDILINDDADLTLSLSPIRHQKRTLSLQDNASAAEYGLTATVGYDLSRKSKLDQATSHSVSRTHSYRHESSALLAKERERTELKAELGVLLANEVFRQVCILNSAENTTSLEVK